MVFLRLVINENMKIYKRKFFWIMSLILLTIIFVNLAFTLNSAEQHPEDWKNSLQSQIDSKQKQINDEDTFAVVKSVLENEVKIGKYQIKNNIMPLYKDTALGFVNSNIGFAGVITFIAIILSSTIVSQEYAWGTIKLVLMRPVERWKVLLAKYVSVAYNTLLMLLILAFISFLIGILIFGWDQQSLRYVYLDSGHIKDVSIFTHFTQYIGSKLIGILIITSFAFMLSTLLKSNALAIALSILIQFGGSIISNLLSNIWNKEFPKYFFFSNTNIYQYFEGTPKDGMSLSFSIIVLLIYFVIFMSISLLVFTKRDVIN